MTIQPAGKVIGGLASTHRFSCVRRAVAIAGVASLALVAGCSDDGIDPPDPELPTLSIADITVTEGDDGIALVAATVNLSDVSTEVVTVDYATAAGTAQSGEDYTDNTGTLTFNSGVIRLDIEIEVNGDTVFEDDETVLISLSNPVNATLAADMAVLTIVNDEPVVGLDARPDNTTCAAPPRPIQDTAVTIEVAYPAAPGFNFPTKILQAPGDASRWYVLEKGGSIMVFDVADPGSPSQYLDFSGQIWTDSEGGVLGMAFHPNFPATPEVFVNYTGFDSGNRSTIVSRIILDDPVTPGATTEEILIVIRQDYNNHNGGDIGFGPDGYLYIGMGDGGAGGDPQGRAQNTRHMLGSFLRIDVVDVAYPAPGYEIPADNPFAGNPKCEPGNTNAQSCPEIYAWGVRNPWRWSFDGPTGKLWAGDVGQNAYEEIDIIELGGNYGWRCYEGFHDFDTSGCNDGSYLEPVAEYGHGLGESITGGYVYRGSAIAALQGRYVFADYTSGRIWALRDNGKGGYVNDELIDTNHSISTFGMDQDGELYFTDLFSGTIYRIVEGGGGASDLVPNLLSQTGCMDAIDVTRPSPGLIPYDINAPFWSDDATKERFMALPDGTTVDVDTDGDWDFPTGTTLVKNFRLSGQLIETRLLVRHPDGLWGGYTYEWNGDETEATRVKGGKVVDIGGQDWIYPSEGQCMECHTAAAGVALGPELAQFNRDFAYPSPGRTANQLLTLEHIGVFTAPLDDDPVNLPTLTVPDDPGADLDMRARAYLHTNCAQCHRPGGPTPSSMDLRYTTLLGATDTCDELPLGGDLGIGNARIIAPGDAARSVLVERMNRRDAHGMPRLGSSIADSDGVALMTTWIDGLAGCP